MSRKKLALGLAFFLGLYGVYTVYSTPYVYAEFSIGSMLGLVARGLVVLLWVLLIWIVGSRNIGNWSWANFFWGSATSPLYAGVLLIVLSFAFELLGVALFVWLILSLGKPTLFLSILIYSGISGALASTGRTPGSAMAVGALSFFGQVIIDLVFAGFGVYGPVDFPGE